MSGVDKNLHKLWGVETVSVGIDGDIHQKAIDDISFIVNINAIIIWNRMSQDGFKIYQWK